MNNKHDINSMKELFKERNCILLSTEYKNSSSKLEYIATCGHKHSISYDNFRSGKGDLCKECRYVLVSKARRLTYETIKQHFENEDCELISKEYKNNSTKLEYIATCGHVNKIDYAKFQFGGGRVCNKCSKSIRYEFDYVFEYFQNEGCLLLETEYINCKTPMRYIAKCGHENITTFDLFCNRGESQKKCKKCSNYMPMVFYKGLPDTHRDIVKSKEWRNAVLVKYNNTCAKCGKENAIMNAHHINGFNYDRENRYNVENGISLCKTCHTKFHSKYGYGLNTKEQFKEWFDGNTERG